MPYYSVNLLRLNLLKATSKLSRCSVTVVTFTFFLSMRVVESKTERKKPLYLVFDRGSE